MNEQQTKNLYAKIKHCNEFINHSNDSNHSKEQLQQSETEMNEVQFDKNNNEDLFKHVKNVLRDQGHI
ncbi:hypothetical protein [Staphylococcus simiae]|uniref:Uncharacterized protein n=1 Tax=Staphylococcus simiae CCM 7213 = CCUG 51256 TaxID=911238 RepID=G5JGB3_9STAP|nr:hypothetical protein [Staphylococcus simiae]EHJ08772.1 hypothetical protein SS7213T_02388 [Staphylococcus simiae CCM 7213 = CCUG 51256]PNZ11928.1 hypothetical protein CD113_07905 [Staphylococcus simiae]SNV68983.1 Uncharacterised protein [Staphylococcus simiae]